MFTSHGAETGLMMAAGILLLISAIFLFLIASRHKENRNICLRWSWGGLVGVLMGVAFLMNRASLALMAAVLGFALTIGMATKKL